MLREEEFLDLFEFYFNLMNKTYVDRILELGLKTYPQSSELLYCSGLQAFYEKRYDRALLYFKKSLIYDTTFFKPHLLKGIVYIELGKIEKAKQSFNDLVNVLQHSPDEYLQELEELILEIFDRYFALEILLNDQEKFEQKEQLILDFLYALVQRYFDKENIYLNFKVVKYLLKKDYQKAETFLIKQVYQSPFNFVLWYNLAQLYIKLHKYFDALEAIDYSLAIYPENYESLYLKAIILFLNEKYQEAITIYLELLDLEIFEESDIYVNIGKCYECLEQYQDATYYYLKAIDSDQTNIQAYVDLGALFLELNELDLSSYYLTEAQKIDKEFPELNYVLADLMLKKGEYIQGIKYINKAIEKKANDTDFILLYSELYEALGKIDKSISVLKKSLNKVEDKARVFYRLAGLYVNMDNEQDAYNNLKKAIDLDNSYIENFLRIYPDAQKYNQLKSLLNLSKN